MRSKLPRNDRPSAARREIEVRKLFDQLQKFGIVTERQFYRAFNRAQKILVSR